MEQHLKRPILSRRGSQGLFAFIVLFSDEITRGNQDFVVDVEVTLRRLLAQEDTDQDMKITVKDRGSKVFRVELAHPESKQYVQIRGTYCLSNLLQELFLSKDSNSPTAVISYLKLTENPVERTSRRIREMFWHNLTRKLDASLIERAAKDPKDWTDDPRPRIYVPFNLSEQHAYYMEIAQKDPKMRLDVQRLPEEGFTPQFVMDLNDRPGILALDMGKSNQAQSNAEGNLQGTQFVVPGGRYNELYYWDSYFCSLGLLQVGLVKVAKQIVQNFCFEIEHYGKILNANRSYYLCRSQPPFLTDLSLRVYEQIQHKVGAKEFLKTAILAAIKEYDQVWMSEPRYDHRTGLSRYRPEGKGIPPEVEETHFDHIILPYVKTHQMTKRDFIEAYNNDAIEEPELDDFFLHDRAVRESGHDTSIRVEGVAADLATIDLNSLLYKYETGIAWAIRNVFDDKLEVRPSRSGSDSMTTVVQTSAMWDDKAAIRKDRIDRYLWNEEKGIYFDYNTAKQQQTTFESVTCFYALWCGVASPAQAASLVSKGLPMFEQTGGLSCGSQRSRGPTDPGIPTRQWDYPFGWAPHQMLAWDGLRRYGYEDEAKRLVYRWLHMITQVVVDHNGAITEKYNVVTTARNAHEVNAEYGNQGLDFEGVAREGFGWTNASYSYGLSIIDRHMKRALGVGASWEDFAKSIKKTQK